MMGRRRTSALVASALLAAVGCGDSLEPIQVREGCPEEPLRGPSQWANEPRELLIDDFEDGDEFLATAAGRTGAWVIGSDASGVLVAENSFRCSARGVRAGHFSGAGFNDWGANWTAVFLPDNSGAAQGYDGRTYGAISFWAALGPEAEPPYDMPVGLTTMDVAWNSSLCIECMDFYRTVVQLSPAWRRYVVPFSALKQRGYGEPLTDLRPEALVGFIIWPTHQFDIWIDDVRFEQ